ncbi:MAG: MarR family transcriptional regulator [Saprospiraceae bacterium]
MRLLLDIPVKMCRNMNQNIIISILKEMNFDISPHHLAILKVLYEKQRSNITEVVDELNITKPQMTASTDKLVLLNYISRENDSRDRRKIYLTLTGEGEEVVRRINIRMENYASEALQELSELELEQLEGGLKVLQKLCINCQEK